MSSRKQTDTRSRPRAQRCCMMVQSLISHPSRMTGWGIEKTSQPGPPRERSSSRAPLVRARWTIPPARVGDLESSGRNSEVFLAWQRSSAPHQRLLAAPGGNRAVFTRRHERRCCPAELLSCLARPHGRRAEPSHDRFEPKASNAAASANVSLPRQCSDRCIQPFPLETIFTAFLDWARERSLVILYQNPSSALSTSTMDPAGVR